MPKPYAQLRAQLSPAAQRQAADKAQAMLAALLPPSTDPGEQGQAMPEDDDDV